eukprot:TRINITY_DN38214_c0_g1_i1.p1 TRINITY_DN38214_c0_g1~~TRINITY_DN38214_c0_g1_i1.p1  ORF type:complete len:604 (+),score=107.13 TRINITY_DN38214_c0_g1_i1:91-1902(+)
MAAALADGVAWCMCGADTMVVHGGAAPNKVWLLSLDTMSWSEERGSGAAPPQRRLHTLCHSSARGRRGRLLLFGGEAAGGGAAEPQMPYWELDLETFQWTAPRCTGDPPAPRAAHAACAVPGPEAAPGEILVVCGGRPPQGTAVAPPGFGDVHVLLLGSLHWARVPQPQGVSHTLCWGLSACSWRQWVILYGGQCADGDPPRHVSLWNAHTGDWGASRAQLSPPPRSMHAAAICGGELVVCGGRDAAQQGLSDIWAWSVEGDEWRCVARSGGLPGGPSAAPLRPLAVAWGHNLVVCCPLTARQVVVPLDGSPRGSPAPSPRRLPAPPSPRARPRPSGAPARRSGLSPPRSATVSPPGGAANLLRQQLADLEARVSELATAPPPRHGGSPAVATAPQPSTAAAPHGPRGPWGEPAGPPPGLQPAAPAPPAAELQELLLAQRSEQREQQERVGGLERELRRLERACAAEMGELRGELAESRRAASALEAAAAQLAERQRPLEEQLRSSQSSQQSAAVTEATISMLVDGVGRLAEAVADLQQQRIAGSSPGPHVEPTPPGRPRDHRRQAHLASLAAQLEAIESDAAHDAAHDTLQHYGSAARPLLA